MSPEQVIEAVLAHAAKAADCALQAAALKRVAQPVRDEAGSLGHPEAAVTRAQSAVHVPIGTTVESSGVEASGSVVVPPPPEPAARAARREADEEREAEGEPRKSHGARWYPETHG